MRKSYIEKKTIISSLETEYVKPELKPKQSTIDFLMSFSKVLYVGKLQGDTKIEFFLN